MYKIGAYVYNPPMTVESMICKQMYITIEHFQYICKKSNNGTTQLFSKTGNYTCLSNSRFSDHEIK